MQSFDDMLPNKAAEELVEKVLTDHGIVCTRNHLPTASTDVGNVSHRCPAIQPVFSITDKCLKKRRHYSFSVVSLLGTWLPLLCVIIWFTGLCLAVLGYISSN